jgi:nucleotide-binding universal stress UspA family protein
MTATSQTTVAPLPADFIPKRTLYLPVDGSKPSHNALEYVLSQICRPDDLMILVHVYQVTTHPEVYSIGVPVQNYIFHGEHSKSFAEHELKVSKAILSALAEEVKEKGFNVQAISIGSQDIRKALDEDIEKTKPSIVILANRGLGKFAGTILGSVSSHLVHYCEFPVMIIPHKP